MNERELLDLKEKIEKAKSKASELKGQHRGLMNTLKSKFECDSIEQAEERLAEMNDEIKGLQAQLGKITKKLESKLN